MIRRLFGRFLVTCDSPYDCGSSLRAAERSEADQTLKAHRWLAIAVGEKKCLFLCGRCQGKVAGMSKDEFQKMYLRAQSLEQAARHGSPA